VEELVVNGRGLENLDVGQRPVPRAVTRSIDFASATQNEESRAFGNVKRREFALHAPEIASFVHRIHSSS